MCKAKSVPGDEINLKVKAKYKAKYLFKTSKHTQDREEQLNQTDNV